MAAELRTAFTRRNLHEDLVTFLREAIVEGEFKPGERLPEQELSRRLNVSRTPLREAFKVLATEGLVTLTPNRGATVASITEEEVGHLFPIMGVLEALGGELAASEMTREEFEALQTKHDCMLAHYAARERVPYLRLNEEIHIEIMQAARNPPLLATWLSLMVRIKRVRFVVAMSEERWAEAVRDHEDLMAALGSRNGAEVSAILKRHVTLKARTVVESFSDAG
jgi:DNA-binding GntR family transcriptional regulator